MFVATDGAHTRNSVAYIYSPSMGHVFRQLELPGAVCKQPIHVYGNAAARPNLVALWMSSHDRHINELHVLMRLKGLIKVLLKNVDI